MNLLRMERKLSVLKRAAAKCSVEPSFDLRGVTRTVIRDRLKRLMEDFATKYRNRRTKYGAGDQIAGLDHFLCNMHYASKDCDCEKVLEKIVSTDKETKNIAARKALIFSSS